MKDYDTDPIKKGTPHIDLERNVAWWLKTHEKIEFFYKEIDYAGTIILEPFLMIEINDRKLKDEAGKIWKMNQERRLKREPEYPEHDIIEYKCINFIPGHWLEGERCANASYHQSHETFKIQVCKILNHFARRDYLQNKTNPNPWLKKPSSQSNDYQRLFGGIS